MGTSLIGRGENGISKKMLRERERINKCLSELIALTAGSGFAFYVAQQTLTSSPDT